MYNLCPPPLLTYPARPSSGGRFDLAIKAGAYSAPDAWAFEPKYNGWRALLHVLTGTLFNRKGQLLSIRPSDDVMLELQETPFEWLDLEFLRNRHDIGKGSVIVLDWPVTDISYESRRGFLGMYFPTLSIHEKPTATHLTPSYGFNEAPAIYEELKLINTRFGCTFYEGLVAKLRSSLYPIQVHSSDHETADWVKHRFTTS